MTEKRRQPSSPRPTRPPQEKVRSKASSEWARAGLKAGLIGGFGILLLLLFSLIQLPLRTCLVLPGFVILLLAVGMLAGLFANNHMKSVREATRVSAVAGFITGIIGAMVAMLLSAFGLMFTNLGFGVLAQFSPTQLENLAQSGISADIIQLAGAVFFALLIWGVGGTIVSLILSTIGGRLYYRLK